MSERIRIQPLAEHEYAVDVTEGTTQTRHRVIVPIDLLTDLGLSGADEQTVVRESIAFLLDREPAKSIYDELPLDTVASRFPDFADALRTRLAGCPHPPQRLPSRVVRTSTQRLDVEVLTAWEGATLMGPLLASAASLFFAVA